MQQCVHVHPNSLTILSPHPSPSKLVLEVYESRHIFVGGLNGSVTWEQTQSQQQKRAALAKLQDEERGYYQAFEHFHLKSDITCLPI